MRKHHVLIIVISFLLLALASGLYYLNKVVLPTVVKEKIVAGLSRATSGKVSVGNVSLGLFKGLIVSDITLYDKDNSENILCSVKEADASFLILPFFKEKKVIFPSVTIRQASINLTRLKDNTFNISYLVDKFKGKNQSAEPSSFFFLVRGVKAKDTVISFKDETFPAPIALTLKIDDFAAGLSWDKVNVRMIAVLERNGQKTNIVLQAGYNISEGAYAGNLRLKNVDLETYQEYLKDLPLREAKGVLSEVKAEFSGDKEKIKSETEFHASAFSFKSDAFSLEKGLLLTANVLLDTPLKDFAKAAHRGKVALEEGHFSIREPFEAKGKLEKSSADFTVDEKARKISLSLHIQDAEGQKDAIKISKVSAEADVEIEIPVSPVENQTVLTRGTVKIAGGEADGIPAIGKAAQIRSDITLQNNEAAFENASAILLDTAVSSKGHFKENKLVADVAGSFDLKRILPLIAQEASLPPHEVSGTADVKLRLSTDTSQKGTPSISGEAAVKDVSFRLIEQDLKFTSDKGRIKFDTSGQNVEWHFEKVIFADQYFSFDGRLKDFKAPRISASIITKDSKLLAEATRTGDLLRLSSLKGGFRNSKADLLGDIALDKKTMVLEGSVSLDLNDLKAFRPSLAEKLEPVKLTGTCLINGKVSGPFADYRKWNVAAKATSSFVQAYGYRIQNIALDYTQIGPQGFVNALSFNAYQGQGLVKGQVDLSGKKMTYSLSSRLANLNLNSLKVDTPGLKDKTFFGICSVNAVLQGSTDDLDTVRGTGNLNIKDGNVWEFNPLKGLGDFLFIPRFRSIAFTTAQGDFSIQDGYVETDNLELQGPELGLLVEGKLGFDGSMDFLVNSQVIPTGKLGVGGKVGEGLAKAGSLTAIRVTGTVKDPRYKLLPITENIMKKISDIFSVITP